MITATAPDMRLRQVTVFGMCFLKPMLKADA